MERFAGFVIRHALAVLAALLGLTIVAVVQIVDVRSGAKCSGELFSGLGVEFGRRKIVER